MAKFNYVAKNKNSQTVKGQEEAASKNELVSNLRARGLFIVSVQAESPVEKTPFTKGRKEAKGKRRSVKVSDLAFLARNLATMLSSGVTLLRSLNLVSRQTESAKLSKVLENCSQDIRGGLSFEEAIRKYPKIFSNLWGGIVQVGEASGNLPFVLNKLADYLEMRMEFETKIKSAMVYPSILVVAATIAVGVFVKVIFPQFQDMFAQFDIDMPAMTVAVLGIANLVEKNFFLFVGLAIVAFIVFNFLKTKPEVKKSLDKLMLKAPIVGNVVFLSCIERFTSVLHILLESGLPLVYSLKVASENIGNTLLESQLSFATKRVREGSSLSDELTRIKIFPLLVSEMARVGEETGNMPDVFDKVSTHYRKALSAKIDRAVAAFEPLMIIFMGLVVGAIVIALFLPMFQLATAH